MQLAPPRAVLLDVGGTVLEERSFDLEAGIAAVVGDDRALVGALAAAFRADLAEHHRQHREILLARWLAERLRERTANPEPAIEDALWPAVVSLRPASDVEAALRRLHDDGVAVAAVSNAAFSGRVLLHELRRHGLGGLVRFVLTSADVGWRKPHATIFRSAVLRLHADASATWFVGDTLSEDVEGAAAAGLQPVWMSSRVDDAPAGVPVVRDWAQFRALYASAR